MTQYAAFNTITKERIISTNMTAIASFVGVTRQTVAKWFSNLDQYKLHKEYIIFSSELVKGKPKTYGPINR